MRDDLLEYYERELTFLRRTGADFAQRYPKVASRLLLEPNKCDDPNVERLLEGFAFLAARVHLKIDDDLPEVSEALLNVVYPHYTRPIPSMSLVEFHLDPEQKLATGLRIPRGSPLFSRAVAGAPCRFRTCYDTVLWPLSVSDARWTAVHELSPPVGATSAVSALRVQLDCPPDLSFAKLEMETLRLHLNAETNLASTLYELLCNNCVEILLRDATPGAKRDPIRLPASALKPVGFAEDEGLLPTSRGSFLGYRLLQEYFSFPEKFFFLDLAGFDRARAAGFGSRMEILFLISSFERPERRQMLETGVNAETIRLGCTPIVNLFKQSSEPILLTERKQEYMIVPDARRRATTGIFSVEEVVAVTPGEAEPITFEPLYSFRHGASQKDKRIFWQARRRPTRWRADEGTDLFLSFADFSARMAHPDRDAVTARLVCFNGDLPSRLPFGDPGGDFEMPGGGAVTKITTLVKPTSAIEPPLGKPQMWRLISQLSMNYLSLVDGGVETLHELLRLHNFADSDAGEKQIQGIVEVEGSPCYSRIESEHGLTFARGHRVEILFDEEQFAGGGVYLLASVLERFLGLYVSLNSFCILAARTRQRKGALREWAPRAGWKALL
ncbi:MAG TPA: type VI secretion system baseplate subunit TssF [Longimicrobiaceae bacterium]|nr:type VI secretion system baseplate subunit TssF [Longimicrobiaceae bacterium]